MHAVGGYPTFPSSNPNSPFWHDLEEVVVSQQLQKIGKIPDFFVLPELWQGWTADEVAEAVHRPSEVKQILVFSASMTFFSTLKNFL